MLVLGFAIIIVLSLIAVFVFYKGQPRRDPAQHWYLRFSKRLHRLGFAQNPQEGAEDFAQRIIREHPEWAASINAITLAYYQSRYGKTESQKESIQRLRRLVREFLRTHR